MQDSQIGQEAKKVVSWATELLGETWPRDDYQELLHLMTVYLGGEVKRFTFRSPGPDHHARWMSKAINYLKLALLSNQFPLTEAEKEGSGYCCRVCGCLLCKAISTVPTCCLCSYQ